MLYGASSRPGSVQPLFLPGHCQGGPGGCRQWEQGGLVTGSIAFSTSHPHVHAHTDGSRVCRGIHTCAEMWIQMLVPDASPPVCLCFPPEEALWYRINSAKLSPQPPAPASACVAGGAGLARGVPCPPSLLRQCQLELSIKDPTAATSGHLKVVRGSQSSVCLDGWDG